MAQFLGPPFDGLSGAHRVDIRYPVAIDNGYRTWDAYANQSWPAAYLIDAGGQIRHVAIGEGDYRAEEAMIRTLLSQAHPGVVLPHPTSVTDTTPSDFVQTPESYLGAGRANSFAGNGSYRPGPRAFTLPRSVPADLYGLTGAWTIGEESITSRTGAGIALNYHASKVYLDVGGTGTLTVTEKGRTRAIPVSGAPNIRTVVSNPAPAAGLVIIALSPGLSVYSFTFG